MRRAAVAFFLAVAAADALAEDLDLSALRDRVAAQIAATTGGERAAYVKLGKALARPDAPGLADDLSRLTAAAAAVEGRLGSDVPLGTAVGNALRASETALRGVFAELVGGAGDLESPEDLERCNEVETKGRDLAALAVESAKALRRKEAATFARNAAVTYERGMGLVARLVARQGRRPAAWSAPLHDLPAALLGVWAGPGPMPAVFAVGADDGAGPVFLRMGPEGWVRVPVAASGTLFTVTGIGDGVWAAGTGGRVVRYAGGNVSDLAVGEDTTIFGVWGATESDVWAVGGNLGGSGTALFHRVGDVWSAVAPPAEVAGRTLFAVTGTAADDVWACGEGGLVLHFDGAAWTARTSSPATDLFGIDRGAAVGGGAEAAIFGVSESKIAAAKAPAGTQGLRGVSVPARGDAWACGVAGALLRRSGGTWKAVAGAPSAAADDFHAVHVDDTGGVWLARGDLTDMTGGSLVYYGPRTPPTAVFQQAKFGERIAPLFSAAPGVERPWTCSVGGCHVKLTPSAELDLFVDAPTMRSRLAGVPSTQTGLLRVLPGRPSRSYLWHKLEGTHLTVGGTGERMPIGTELEQHDLDAVRAWIVEGALDD